MNTRAERAAWKLEDIAHHIERAAENLDEFAAAYSEASSQGHAMTPYALAWKFLDLDVAATVRVDARRLLAAVHAVLALAEAGSPITPEDLRAAVVRNLTPTEET